MPLTSSLSSLLFLSLVYLPTLTTFGVISFILTTFTSLSWRFSNSLMAPVTSHDSIRDIFYNALSKRIPRWKRADSEGGSKPNNTGYVAAIAILSAIIVGYMLYKAVRWYAARHFARTGRPVRLLDHKRAARRMSKVHQEGRQTMIADISVTEANASYSQFSALGSAQSNEFSPSSAKQFLPLSATGPKTPKLEWRPPTLNSWSKLSSAGNTPTPSKLESGAMDAGSVSYPTQAHAEQGRRKEKRDFFSFVKGRGGKADAYDALTSPPPGEIQARIDNDSTNPPPVEIARGRGHNGAISPPLPPLPPATPTPLRRKSTRKAAPAIDETESSEGRMSKELSSRPASRATTVTVKGSRLTNASIDFSQRRTSAVPSPRVSSLYRSRLSSHALASPNLPHPPVPPMPSLPAFLLAQQQAATSLNRSSSVRTTASTSKNTDSMASIPNNHRAHDTAASSTLLPESIVPPSIASSEEMVTDTTKGLDGQPLPRTMVVTATFTPSLSDELPITIGETVSMLEEYIDGWCFVQRVRVHLKPGVKAPSPTEELVDPEDTIVVPVDGEGNSGAVPRFCVSEWPLPAEIIRHLQAQHNAELAGQKDASTKEGGNNKGIVEKTPTQPLQSFLPSPIGLEDKSPMMPNSAAPVYPPSTTTMPLAKKQEQRKGLNDFAIPTPSDVPDSKFSSWGSSIAPSSAKMPGIYSTMQANTHINAISPPLPPSASSSVPPFSSSSASSTAVHSGASASSNTLHSSSDARHAISSTNSSSSASQAHTSDSGSASTSRVVSVVSQPAPAAPPASPATSPTEQDQEEDDGIKRVSKPPLAPRLSRFPTTAGAHDEDIGPEEEFDPRLLQHMKSYTEASKGHIMDVPRASDRTVTMPPLSRKLPTVSADATAPPVPDLPSSNANGFQLQNAQGGRAAYGYPNGYGNGLPSAMSSAMDTGVGTSVGSKTPSTSNTHARSGSITKRFTSFASGASARDRSGSVGMGSVAGPRPVASSSSDRKGAGGPGVVSFKALRTGSSTANVGVVGR